jgi:hypothetical protein
MGSYFLHTAPGKEEVDVPVNKLIKQKRQNSTPTLRIPLPRRVKIYTAQPYQHSHE